ncbi:MAG: ATP-binding protein [Verrucomicrobia bacterium]|nr:ATP-binding protein [Verrucomicrobiota bacterium]
MKKKAPRGGRRAVKRVRAARTAPVALLAAALRAQSEGVFIAERKCGPQGVRIVFANESFCTMTGHGTADLVHRAHGFLHLERADLERLRHWLPKAKPGQPLVGEGFLRRADGSSIAAAWSFDLLGNGRSRATHIVATYRDLTEKRRLQEALVHSQRLDAVGRLAGGVAHDFNNLLSVINGYCEMLAAHVAANPQAMREVAEIHHAGRKAAALTQQLLAFSRRQPLNARVIRLNELVTSNVEIMRRLVGDAGKIEIELDPGLANVRTDPAQFQQVVLNLVLNARDALRDRGRIVITTANREIAPALHRRQTDTPPGRYVAISVADNGTGMDAETQKHLFEPFFTTKPEGKGTGLGLALVYGVVQQSGGFIAVRSALLVGTTVEILLPAVNEAVEEPPATVAPLPTTRGTETVLLVEDDEVVRKMVAGILTADGYRVIAAATAGAALRDLRDLTRPVQLLIANLAGDGGKFARRLGRTHPDLRVLCTGPADVGNPGWLAPARLVRLSKPYALSELLKTARKLLDA